MRITLRTPTALVIEDKPTALRALGLFLLAFSGILVLVVRSGNQSGSAIVPTVLAVVCAVGGIAALGLPTTLLYAFDREQKLVIITSRSMRGTFRRTIPLGDVAGVELEQSRSLSKSTPSASTWRVALVLADGRREPWRSWYDSMYRSKAQAVEEIRRFLGVTSSEALAAVSPAAATYALESPNRSMAGLGLMAVFCALFLVVGLGVFASQERKLRTYRPVAAEVLSTSVEYRSGDDGGTWLPVVSYRYEVDGRTYVSNRLGPVTVSSGRGWAERRIAPYAPGQRATAYYDPAAPDRAFLVRERSLFPWLFMSVPLLALFVIALAMRGVQRDRRERSLGRAA